MMKINTKKQLILVAGIVLFILVCALPVFSAAVPAADKGNISADVPENWLAKVQQDIAAREYNINPAAHHDPAIGKALQAPNRRQNLRTWFTSEGIMVQRRIKEDNPWSFRLRPEEVGVAGAMRKMKFDKPKADGSRVTYPGKHLDQWFENRPEGLEQGFTIPKSLGDGELLITLNVTGGLKPVLKTPKTLELFTPAGVRILEYGNLLVTDAAHHTLPSRFSLAGAQLTIHIDTTGASYPLTVDPLLSSLTWQAESNQDGAWFGYSVSSAGDVNGDGYDDVIVGADLYDSGETDEGAAFVYLGSASGLAATASWQAEGDQAYSNFGSSVSMAGDVNGDGYDDVIVGAPGYDSGEAHEGATFVYLGSASGLAATASWQAESNQTYALFGYSVSTAGDVNGDGYADVIVGASYYDHNETDEGAAFVYLGSSTGLAAAPSWQAESNQDEAHFGFSVSSAGDVNGDGYADVIVGARYYDNGETHEGTAFVYLGSASGLAATASWQAESNQVGASFGYSVSMAGDVNGDGYADVIVGAHDYDSGETDEGAAFVYLGSASGLAAAPAWQAEGDQAEAYFGFSVSSAGDVNGDGYDDVIVGADLYDSGETDEGAAFVYLGSNINLSILPGWYTGSNQVDAHFGFSVSTAGDVNNDGYDDVIIGAPDYDNGAAGEGMVFAYQGSATGLDDDFFWWWSPNQAYAHFGYSVSTAGDVNNDSYDDIIVGAPDYDNGETDEGAAFVFPGMLTGISSTSWPLESNQAYAHFGYSVSTAGDVDNDGYADVIVGAPDYDHNETDEGAVFVYPGVSTGVSNIPWPLESNQADAHLGFSVSTAGDVNNDGYADIVAGAPEYDNGENNEGAAFVWNGMADGLYPPLVLESNQGGAFFGHAVATAGDINGDGYDDVIVGAPDYDNGETDEGAAFVYPGTFLGLSFIPFWVLESNRAGSGFGYAVATAGDINGDGYDDVIVGIPYYSNDEVVEGAVAVYTGSPAGFSIFPAYEVESNQTGSGFGLAVASAGDVNSNGCDELIVGAPYFDSGQTDEGLAFLYYGIPVYHVPTDFNGDGTHDIALFYPDNHKWYIKDGSISTYGTSECIPVPGDYNGDGTTDMAVVDLSRSDGRDKWYLDGIGVFIYGLQEWIPVPGDYNGDWSTDAALFDPVTGKWYVKDQFVTTYGAGCIPVPGDYNGDNITDIAVFNPANNKWYIKDIGIFTYGMADCIPVPADYDSDGITDLAVIDTSRPDGMAKWYIRSQAVFIYGAVDNTIPVPGDYDGDGAADPCLFYQNTGKWYARNVGVSTYGNGDMIPLASNLAIRYAMSAPGEVVW